MADQRYRVVDRIEAGGMAEVFRAEASSVQGFKKQVAIKRVLPHLAQNDDFIAMFLDEARLGARLNHANIVTVFDIGAADNTYFIVMEFVDGTNLKGLMEALRQQGRNFPLKEAIYICIEACRGLNYAHETLDDEGEPLGIVHRDVSPPNILLSKRGEIKLTDFGLAKASTQLEKTDPGVVKGKFSYLAPEAALGKDVDARADVFALGIVLWEMLAGRRLFLGDTDYQTVKLVQQANIPSLSRINPEVDAEFEALLGKALAQDPDARMQSARDFGDSLAGYIFKHQMKVTSYDIANLMKGAGIDKKKKTKKRAEDQSIIDRLIQEELLNFTSLDDLAEQPLKPGAQPLGATDVPGAQPLDGGAFSALENPADWFSDDDEVADAIADHSRGSAPEGELLWRETGASDGSEDLSSLLEGDTGQHRVPPSAAVPPPAAPAPPPATPAPRPREDHTPPVPLQTRRASTPSPPPAQPAPKKRGGPWLVLLFLLVVAGAGAAAWFGGLIPQ